jgi:hypothetical protein
MHSLFLTKLWIVVVLSRGEDLIGVVTPHLLATLDVMASEAKVLVAEWLPYLCSGVVKPRTRSGGFVPGPITCM